jgi:ERCC4-type nuclease
MRHRWRTGEGYMLDWIAGRKAAHDLVSSIKDSRYSERQKIRISRCG